MRKLTVSGLLVSGLITLGAATLTAENKYDLSQAQFEDIVQKFAAKEAAFSKAREAYTYRQTARIQGLDNRANLIGGWEAISEIGVIPQGKVGDDVQTSASPT